jgi:hypothetical protein
VQGDVLAPLSDVDLMIPCHIGNVQHTAKYPIGAYGWVLNTGTIVGHCLCCFFFPFVTAYL